MNTSHADDDRPPAAPAAPPGERRRARTVALQVLYELDATSHEPATALQRRVEDDETPPAAVAYARRLVDGVRAHQPEIDRQIATAAPAWPLEQMSRVDKSILRLAIFEMLYMPGLPPKVAINEAVELAKIFGHESAPRFVNGVLGSIERSQRQSA
ncbi:MAG: transcription antitermination factor NusB [Chloroflexota bacterium]